MQGSGHYVEVNEAMVWATCCGADWWNFFRQQLERQQRVEVIDVSLGGDRVRVACDDRDHAKWLVGHMVDFGGLPRGAIRAGQATGAAESHQEARKGVQR